MKNYLLNRIREPSTWAGFAVLLSLFGQSVNPDTLGLIQQSVTGVAGLIAVIANERAAP